MDRDKALDLLKLDPDATPAEIDTRYEQIAAFLSPDSGAPEALHDALLQSGSMMSVAYNSLSKPQPGSTQEKKPEDQSAGDQPANGSTGGPKVAVGPGSTAGHAPIFSDEWWKSYRTPVIITLSLVGAGLLFIPDLPHPPPPPPPQPMEVSPGPSPSGPAPDTTPPVPPDIPPSSNLQPPLKIDPALTPMPNPSPLIVEPTQEPDKFLWTFFNDLSTGKDVSGMIRQPEPLTLLMIRARKHSCPAYWNLPSDAITVVSHSPGKATLRVQERYFTGQDLVRDYSLVSDNGTWKVSGALPVAPGSAG